MLTVLNTTLLLFLQREASVCPVRFSVALNHRISIDFFSSGYWDVSLPRVPYPRGLFMKSHSEISGSMATCASPELIAACHVLLHLSSLVIHLITCRFYFIITLRIVIFLKLSYLYLDCRPTWITEYEHKIEQLSVLWMRACEAQHILSHTPLCE